MAMYKALSYFIIFTVTSVNGDFLKDLDKLDIDSKLKEIDKAINSIDKGDDSVLDKVKPKRKVKEDDDPTLGSAVEMLADMFGGECKYQCKNGNKPVPKAEHVVTSNGCGSDDIKINTDDAPELEECCHIHDYCYDTCNSDRNTCDRDFKECLHNTCKKILDTEPSKKKMSYKDCKVTADLMYSGTAALGCDAFLKSQKNACSCSKAPEQGKSKKSGSENVRNASKKEQKDRKSSGRRNDEL